MKNHTHTHTFYDHILFGIGNFLFSSFHRCTPYDRCFAFILLPSFLLRFQFLAFSFVAMFLFLYFTICIQTSFCVRIVRSKMNYISFCIECWIGRCVWIVYLNCCCCCRFVVNTEHLVYVLKAVLVVPINLKTKMNKFRMTHTFTRSSKRLKTTREMKRITWKQRPLYSKTVYIT